MALGIRGSSPIWLEADLQGNLFDDTFYLFVLENTIPYIPAPVFHDPDLSTVWTNPIRFLGNGTLPVDIYFETDKVYRLEFRQGPTQQDPLIYEVNNYIAGTGGSTPVDTIAFASSNQVTNPQFALINLQNPVTISGTNPDPIVIGPGWLLSLAGTGSVTITRVALNNANPNPSNAPYALQLTLSGWTTDSVILRQRLQSNGMLWANKIVSTAVTAKLNGTPQSIFATLADSNNAVLGTVLPLTPINEAWNEYTGYAQLPASTNPNIPPAAYIDYLLHLPSNIDIYLTSFQLVVQDLPVQPSFEQDSINRQIDHTYHSAFPIVPVGTIIDFGGFVLPQHYYLCDGTAIDRVHNFLLFNAITTTETVTLTSGVNTFTVASNVNYHIGMAIEGARIPVSTIINSISGTTITMSANATSTGSSLVRFFAWGGGNGSTTFNLPELKDFVTAGANGFIFGTTTPNGVGMKGGSLDATLTMDNIPSHDHPGSIVKAPSGTRLATAGSGVAAVSDNTTPNTQVTVAPQGGLGGITQPFFIVQATALVKKCIRYQ